jgi:SAM-dependent methyltransferase
MRTIKSFVKELTGINNASRKEFLKQLGIFKWPKLNLLQGDAKNIPLPNEYFDFIYSIDVFEHLDDPEPVLNEIIRLLRPGGVMWLAFVGFSNPNAFHDLRWITGSSDAPPAWSHLIPEQSHLIQQGAFINTLRFGDWQSLISQKCYGVIFEKEKSNDPRLDGMIDKYRSLGYLDDYSDEELLTERLIVAWQKPIHPAL